jgi:hypothetical protein
VRPIDRQINSDTRQLGLWLTAFQIERAPIIPINTKVSATAGEELGLPVAGWSPAENEGVWTHDSSATLAGWLSGPIGGPAWLRVWGHAIAPEPGGSQLISVLINERVIATWSLRDFENTERYAEIPRDIDLAGPLKIRFLIDKPVRPIDRQINSDTRQLGLWLDAFQIEGNVSPFGGGVVGVSEPWERDHR